MHTLYIKTRFGIKEIISTENAARLLGIRPSTFTAYLAREQIFIKKIRIKNLVFFLKEDIENIRDNRKESKKEEQTINLF